ncbi:MAG TPA: hypothetical protein VGF85_09030 [Opitutaceae bacterium]
MRPEFRFRPGAACPSSRPSERPNTARPWSFWERPRSIDADAFKTAEVGLEEELRLVCEKVHAYGDIPLGQ